MRTLASDIRWSLRLIRRRPAFATTVVLTLAGSIAAVATAFGVTRAVLWRPLPFADAARLAFVWEDTGANGGTDAARVTGYRFTQWQRQTRTASSMALFGAAGFFADLGTGPAMINGVRVSTNYFRTLGITPELGRDFTDVDGEPARRAWSCCRTGCGSKGSAVEPMRSGRACTWVDGSTWSSG